MHKKITKTVRDLFECINNNRQADLEYMIIFGSDVNTRNVNGNTPLHVAARKGNIQILKLLISYGANLYEPDMNGNSPIHIAALHGNIETLSILISSGANLNQQNIHGNTPAHIAALNNNIETLELLISSGVNLNQQNIHGNTPAHIAATNGFVEIIDLLLKHNIDLTVLNKSNKTPLEVATNKSKYISSAKFSKLLSNEGCKTITKMINKRLHDQQSDSDASDSSSHQDSMAADDRDADSVTNNQHSNSIDSDQNDDKKVTRYTNDNVSEFFLLEVALKSFYTWLNKLPEWLQDQITNYISIKEMIKHVSQSSASCEIKKIEQEFSKQMNITDEDDESTSADYNLYGKAQVSYTLVEKLVDTKVLGEASIMPMANINCHS